jgi:V/A-type H+-transporting ATPase subunit E
LSAGKGVRLIVEDILEEASEKAAEVVRAAKKETKTILDAARFRAKEDEEREIRRARAQGGQIYDEILAGGRMRAKREVLKRREELINEVFKEVEKKLHAYVTSKKYEDDIVRITINACKKLGSESPIIYANRRDLKLLEKSKDKITHGLEGREKPANISFGEPIQAVGGVKVGTPDHQVEIDETFDGRMKREFEALRVKVAKILFEGSR